MTAVVISLTERLDAKRAREVAYSKVEARRMEAALKEAERKAMDRAEWDKYVAQYESEQT
jgi:DnaJ-domain-containing protein 1